MARLLPGVTLPAIRFRDGRLAPLWERLRAGERLGREDGLLLHETGDLVGLGRMASAFKRALWGDRVHFIVNRQVNPTNACVLSCRFCEFAAKVGDPRAYEMSIDEVLARCAGDVREVHIVGGLHPEWPFATYLELVRAIRRRYPRLQIKAWTAVEIDWFARIERTTVENVLLRLKDAGLDMLPGGGAEVFSERIRRLLFPQKIGADRWLEIHRTAHRLGIATNSTLLFGHIETPAERVEHLLRLRELQDETGGFLAFIPLAFQPGNTGITMRRAPATEDLRTVAVSRLLFDNVPHVKAYWVMLGEETAAAALHFGADDIDGTIGEERIAHAAGAPSALSLTKAALLHLIADAGGTPVERDALYRPVSEAAEGAADGGEDGANPSGGSDRVSERPAVLP